MISNLLNDVMLFIFLQDKMIRFKDIFLNFDRSSPFLVAS